MYDIQVSTTAYELLFPLILASDHISPALTKSPTVTIRKAGGSFGSPSGTVTEVANGWYKVAGNATDSNTLGPLVLHATEASSDPTDVVYNVVAYNPQDAVRLGLTALPNANAEAAGGLFTRGTGAGQLNQDANGRHDVNAVAWKGGTIVTPAVTGVPKVDVADWLGSAPDALSSGKIPSDLKLWLTVAPDALSSGKVAADVKLWLASAPDALSSGKLPADLKLWLASAPNALVSGRLPVAAGYAKNTSAAVQFEMVDSTGNPVTGLTNGSFTAKQESIDAAAFATLSGTITEVSGSRGLYTITLTSGEFNVANITFYFTAPGCRTRMFTIRTNS